MDTINSLLTAMLVILPSAAVPRGVYCYYKYVSDDEQGSLYMRRLKNLLVFTVIAETVTGLLNIILNYIT